MVMLSAVDGPPGLSVVAVHGPGGPSMTAACGPGRPIGGGPSVVWQTKFRDIGNIINTCAYLT